MGTSPLVTSKPRTCTTNNTSRRLKENMSKSLSVVKKDSSKERHMTTTPKFSRLTTKPPTVSFTLSTTSFSQPKRETKLTPLPCKFKLGFSNLTFLLYLCVTHTSLYIPYQFLNFFYY